MTQAVAAERSHRVLSKATWRAARQLGLSGAALAKVIGLSEATVSRLGRGEWKVSPQSKEGQLAALLVRLFRSLDAVVGNDASKVAAWMGSFNRALNGVPRELIESPQGLVMTLQYVDAMRATS
ncbi:MAG: XRE family transcriptional regulator [Rhizobacter sp.]|nr:XRE family transcriptional regulator [Rhizobacter sp.]